MALENHALLNEYQTGWEMKTLNFRVSKHKDYMIHFGGVFLVKKN